MRTLLSLCYAMMLVLGLGVGSVVHATEPTGSPIRIVAQLGCQVEDGCHEKTSDMGGGVAHHHGSCHGHHIGITAPTPAVSAVPAPSALLALPDEARTQDLTQHEFLRPPIG